MDDLRAWMYAVRLGWRGVEGGLVFKSEWRKEEHEKKMTGLQKSVEILHGMMNCVNGFLNMTIALFLSLTMTQSYLLLLEREQWI